MTEFKVGDIVSISSWPRDPGWFDGRGSYAFLLGDMGQIIEINPSSVTIDWLTGANLHAKGIGYRGFWRVSDEFWPFLRICPTSSISSPSISMNVVQAARNLLLSKEERQFRKVGLKDDCGNWTEMARQAFIERKMNDDATTADGILQSLSNDLKAEQDAECKSCK